jgi:hypothetical protein
MLSQAHYEPLVALAPQKMAMPAKAGTSSRSDSRRIVSEFVGNALVGANYPDWRRVDDAGGRPSDHRDQPRRGIDRATFILP